MRVQAQEPFSRQLAKGLPDRGSADIELLRYIGLYQAIPRVDLASEDR